MWNQTRYLATIDSNTKDKLIDGLDGIIQHIFGRPDTMQAYLTQVEEDIDKAIAPDNVRLAIKFLKLNVIADPELN